MNNNLLSGIWAIGSSNSAQTPVNASQVSSFNQNNIQQGETYQQYGLRICGRVTASHTVLSSYLSGIFVSEKQKQLNDTKLQNNLRQQKQVKLTQIEKQIQQEEAAVQKSDNQIKCLQEKKRDAEDRLSDAKTKDGQINKLARLKLILGIAILVLLTIYLFIFYSSTFYSAFLMNAADSVDINLGTAMFNGGAIKEASSHGFGELIFILTAPVIFLGLGFCLHFFMVQSGNAKWFKIASLLFITFSFDCILAYKIGKALYNIDIMTKMGDFPDYNIIMAIGDVDTWAVIFCGFIVYLIWGIVFDMTVTAYDELRSNKHEITKLNREISDLVNDEESARNQKLSKEADIKNLITERASLQNELQNTSGFYDNLPIRNALNDFYAGWVTMMASLLKPLVEQDRARQIYDDTMRQLFN